MAKIKGRIGNRGKIRPLVRKRPEKRGPHWSITKREAVNRRRRIIDDVFLTETINLSDELLFVTSRDLADSISLSDTANINNEKVIINSQTITDDDGISKNFEQPANADSIGLSDSVGFELGTLSSVFNTSKINDALFNAVGANQEFYTDSITTSDSVSLSTTSGQSDTATISDSVGLNFIVSSIFNANSINLSQFNS